MNWTLLLAIFAPLFVVLLIPSLFYFKWWFKSEKKSKLHSFFAHTTIAVLSSCGMFSLICFYFWIYAIIEAATK